MYRYNNGEMSSSDCKTRSKSLRVRGLFLRAFPLNHRRPCLALLAWFRRNPSVRTSQPPVWRRLNTRRVAPMPRKPCYCRSLGPAAPRCSNPTRVGWIQHTVQVLKTDTGPAAHMDTGAGLAVVCAMDDLCPRTLTGGMCSTLVLIWLRTGRGLSARALGNLSRAQE